MAGATGHVEPCGDWLALVGRDVSAVQTARRDVAAISGILADPSGRRSGGCNGFACTLHGAQLVSYPLAEPDIARSRHSARQATPGHRITGIDLLATLAHAYTRTRLPARKAPRDRHV